jgi:hypothetical protein
MPLPPKNTGAVGHVLTSCFRIEKRHLGGGILALLNRIRSSLALILRAAPSKYLGGVIRDAFRRAL